ncbi:glycosyltransferase family 2 protein [Acidocella aminolytica]|nr:glycosyltransferase [Acidocella aminolytica]SHE59602.1 Glycosyl transferase family 2 [Acidocella aminolytica 101 = DSM 11237]
MMVVEFGREPFQKRLGIAVTTFNRREMVLELVAKIRAMTTSPFDLVICDDGSGDGTVEALRERGEVVVSGINRGIAWNKNRGIYYLLHTCQCDVVLLLDDDVVPVCRGWEQEWIVAANAHGHVNFVHPIFHSRVIMGENKAENPGMCTMLNGCALVFDRLVLAQIGFMDTRFGRYGHEHTEMTLRAVRAGYGGVFLKAPEGGSHLFKVIGGGLEALAVDGHGSQAEALANDAIMASIRNDPVYRHAWREDQAMAVFLAEQDEALSALGQKRPYNKNIFPSLEAYQRFRQEQGIDSVDSSLAFLIGDTMPSLIEEALSEGQRAVAVEPDAKLYYALAERFADAIAEGRLVLENFAPAPRGGEIAMLTPRDGGRPYPVATISWGELVAKHGRPARVHMAAEIPGFPTMTG